MSSLGQNERAPRIAGSHLDLHTPQTIDTSVSVVVPTYREVDNLPALLDRLAAFRESSGMQLDVLLIDDGSDDGSVELVAERDEPWVRIVVRSAPRDLATAAIDGCHRAEGEYLVVMGADLSHPPEAIPEMLHLLDEGADLVVGSRFVGTGKAIGMRPLRRLRNHVANRLARGLTTLKDPTSGFVALRRSLLDHAHGLRPIGHGVALELAVRCHCQEVREIAFDFQPRRHGPSKLDRRAWLDHLRHLARLRCYRLACRLGLRQLARRL